LIVLLKPISVFDLEVALSFGMLRCVAAATAAALTWCLQELLLLAADLSVFGRYTAASAAQAPDGVVSVSFTDVVFPKGGQYVLVVNGLLPLPTAAADGSQQQQQIVSLSTFIGVGAGPSNSLAARYNGSRAGLKEVTVRSRPLQQQHSHRFEELVVPDGSSSSASAAAAAPGSSNRSSSQSQAAYRVALDTPASCVPGQLATYTWTLWHAGSGEPVSDLQLQDGAALRLVIASADLSHLQLTAGRGQPLNAASRARSSSGAGASAYMHGSRAAARSTVAEAAATTNTTVVNNGDVQQQQQQGGRRLLAPEAALRATLRKLQQADSTSAGADGSSSSSSRGAQFGPSVSAQVSLSSYGAYLFVAEVVRGGDELIVIPFYVMCSNGDTHIESAAATLRASGASAVRTRQPLSMLAWAALVLVLQALVL
jgi:hypothetical protein